MKILLFVIFTIFSGGTLAQSIVYDGFECEGDQMPSTTPAQSRFEVIEDLGGGSFKLLITGGIPLFETSLHDKVCVGGSGVIFGSESFTSNNQIFQDKDSVEATAFFSGNRLVVTFLSFWVVGEALVLDAGYRASPVFPTSYTLTFEYLPETSSFKLINSMFHMGLVFSFGVTTRGEWVESREISSSGSNAPLVNIEYFFE